MLAGRPPFQAETMADSADRILNHEPEALARFNYAVPADVDALVRKALAKDPAFRYQSARELYVDLHHARDRMNRASTDGRTSLRPGMMMPPVGFGNTTPRPRPAPAGRTVAVLTFANLTGNPADEWVGQGIAESLTADFAKIARPQDHPARADVRRPARVERRPGPGRRRAPVDRARPPARAPPGWSAARCSGSAIGCG